MVGDDWTCCEEQRIVLGCSWEVQRDILRIGMLD